MLLEDIKKKFLKKGRPIWLRKALLNREDTLISSSPFYKIYPYTGKMRVRDVDWRSVVNHDLKIFYHRIPKNGNSSLVSSIEQISRNEELSRDIQSKRIVKKSSTIPSTLNHEESESIATYFKFFIARNPYDRALSAYLSKVVGKIKSGKPVKMLHHGTESTPSFHDFCTFLSDGGLYADHHWSPQIDYLIFPIENYDFMAKLENINSDFKIITEKFGIDPNKFNMISEDPTHRTGAANRHKEFYSQKLYDMIYEIYNNDFTSLGYDSHSHP